MSASLSDTTLREYLTSVAAREPAPGGGAATAVTLATSAALVGMAARFAGLDDRAASADELRDEAAALADRDVAAYGDYLTARRTDGPSSRAARDALTRATDVPLEMARLGAHLAVLADEVLALGRPALLGDATTAALLAAAATRAAAVLVRCNAGPDDPRTRQADQHADAAAVRTDAPAGDLRRR